MSWVALGLPVGPGIVKLEAVQLLDTWTLMRHLNKVGEQEQSFGG